MKHAELNKMYACLIHGIRVFSAVGHFGWVVLAKFWGESIRPFLVGHFGRGSFRPMSGGYTTYLGLDPASTVYPIKISGLSGISK